MALDVQLAWIIECWRCANTGEWDADNTPTEPESARQEFASAGWSQTQDGYQLCPKCSAG